MSRGIYTVKSYLNCCIEGIQDNFSRYTLLTPVPLNMDLDTVNRANFAVRDPTFFTISHNYAKTQIRCLYTCTVMWMITNCRSRGRPEERAVTLTRSSSGSGSRTTRDIAMAPSAPLCPMITPLTK